MRIKRLKLYRFRGFEDLQITFPADAKTIVFIGENGSGKTSLIDGISMILREALYKHHQYDAVDWGNPLNVNNNYPRGKIELGIQGAKRDYDFSQTLSADRTRFVAEERLALDLGRDLTKEEKIVHYKEQADMAYDNGNYKIALEKYLKLTELCSENIDVIQNPRDMWRIAYCFHYNREYEKAINYYEKSLYLVDENNTSTTYYNLANAHYFNENYTKALEFSLKALSIQKDLQNDNKKEISDTYYLVALSMHMLQKSDEAIQYYEHTIRIYEEYMRDDIENLAKVYANLGLNYENIKKYEEAIKYYNMTLKLEGERDTINTSFLKHIYEHLSNSYLSLGDIELSKQYLDKAKNTHSHAKIVLRNTYIPLLYRTNEPEMLKHFTEYVETWVSLIVHYSARHTSTEAFKDALPIAFEVPMTTNFDMVSDWFTQHENDENRKRLRVKPDYRSLELETIREVILHGLTLLNGNENHFSELQTEIEETVRDGQVSSWLSIKKDGLRLNVKQLSDGEKRVIILLIDIARRLITVGKNNNDTNYLNGTGVILIDEIEQHLHPKWQRNLLPTLTKIFPKLQFVVATHSPQILSYVPNGCAFSLEQGKAYPQSTFGRNNEWILEAIMHDVSRPKEVQEKLDAYFDAIREDRTEEAQQLRAWLETEIGADEPELLKADILIRRKQKTLAKNETN